MSKIEELDPLLKSLEALKPPGASKSKIQAITQICVDSVQADSVVAQKLFTHFKRTPSTHKLGILYVVDSITRQWIERAKASGQELSGSGAADGTYASGVHKMTELMPTLVDDMIKVSPQDQKDKVENLVNIWEKGGTFPAKMLATFKQKLKAAHASAVKSSTPPGSPPQAMLNSYGLHHNGSQRPSQQSQPQPPASQTDASSILKALAGLGGQQQQQQQQVAAAAPPPPQLSQPQDLSALLSSLGQQQPPPPPSAPPVQQFQPPPPPPIQNGIPPQFAALFQGAAPPPPQPPPQQTPQPPPAQNPLQALTALVPPHIMGNPEALTKVLQLFGELMKNNIPQDQWGPVVAALYPTQPGQGGLPPPNMTGAWQPPNQQSSFQSRDSGYSSYGGRRDRSRSPDYRRENANRRGSPVYGTYDASARDRQDDDSRGRRQDSGPSSRYRQRTPPGGNFSSNGGMQYGPPATKWTDIDPTLPPGRIKVLSRTLFVGGASGSESELRQIFSRFGQVQTCIVNNDKRHAFVKMCTRADAVRARDEMERMRDPDVLSKARQTKWGVGFGPRECCDYTTGVSTIPIDSLTDADQKWVLTAEYGGTGNRPIESGLVFEEPDIEIGAGVSSKAMSRRVGPGESSSSGGGGGGGGGGGRNRGRGGNNEDGGRQGRGGGGRFRQGGGGGGGGGGQYYGQGQQQQGHYGQQDRFNSPRPEPINVQPPPPVPNFGFQFAMPGQGGMPPFQ